MILKEQEEDSKRIKLQKLTEEAEQKRRATEFARREEQRIRREIEERELQEALELRQAMLLESEKRGKKKGKKQPIDGVRNEQPLVMIFDNILLPEHWIIVIKANPLTAQRLTKCRNICGMLCRRR